MNFLVDHFIFFIMALVIGVIMIITLFAVLPDFSNLIQVTVKGFMG